MTNSLKHAFPDGQKGNLWIKMHSVDGKNYELVVKDDGIGIPGNLNMEKPETLGLKLIDSLVKQIDGTMEINSGKGTEFVIKFSEE